MVNGMSMLECMEKGFANFEGNLNSQAFEDCLILHRFQVFVWLMQNGVSIPIELLNDNLHQTSLQKQIKKETT